MPDVLRQIRSGADGISDPDWYENKAEAKGKPDLNILFIYNMPFRAIGKMAGGMVSDKQFILVINAGAPIDLSPVDNIPGVNAIVYMNQLGMEGGNALAAVLTGKRSPCGKLAVTWAKHYMDYPYSDEFGPYAKDQNHALYKEGIYVGYRYFDSFLVEPRYPFGYGKGYTEFQIETGDPSIVGTDVQLHVRVSNIGKNYAGKEVIQLYASCPQEGQAKEYQRLAAFGKTKLLSPGESEMLTLRFSLPALASFDEKDAETYLEAGCYLLRIGSSSRATVPAVRLSLPQRVTLSRHRHLCTPTNVIRELDENRVHDRMEEIPDGLAELSIDPECFTPIVHRYASRQERFLEKTEGYLSGFSAEDMAKFCAGTGLFGEKKGFCTPGAVGHTTTDYLDRGIPNAELCDGLAGLRLQRRSTVDKKGNIKAVDSPMSLYEFLPRFVQKLLLGNPKKERMLFQFATGFPVAAAVAQSWNTDLALEIGRAVSVEMIEYGVTWWLAPALNTVRNDRSAYGIAKKYVDEEQYVKDAKWGPDTPTLQAAGSTLNDILVEGFTKIIIGEKPIDYFDEVVEQWRTAGGDQATAEINETYGK